ncbi:MAG: HNH endonuclease [Verrucomicrobiales bacterium]|nr:HNH endonuclease [Verrucomicrobiales bacterium]
MKYWWVNQNQTGKHEIAGRYMWSPKRNKNGAFNQFYENMKLVTAGDMVFSYIDTRIPYIGVVQHHAVPAAKPEAFGSAGEYWSNDGWFVAVVWHSLDEIIRPKDHIQLIRPTLPMKYSPIQHKTGNGLQSVYLAEVPDEMAATLLELMKEPIIPGAGSFSVKDEAPIEQIEDAVQKSVEDDKSLSDTEKLALVAARKGQGKFRENVSKLEPHCRVTGVTDHRLLRASHIKPWRACETAHERLDGNNGLLLAANIDHLFDKGFISFSDEGAILISRRIDDSQMLLLGIDSGASNLVGQFRPAQQKYLDYHRENVFRH